ncbi:hypothetical protein D3C76_1099090 [compost metagenome]
MQHCTAKQLQVDPGHQHGGAQAEWQPGDIDLDVPGVEEHQALNQADGQVEQ